VRSALLRGREHLELGAVELVAEGRAAIALSRGGALKRYAHTDLNEDCAAFARGHHGLLLAVADGHSGFEASELVVEHLLANPAPQWTDDAESPDAQSWARHALATLCDANAEILAERSGASSGSSTTLCLALLLPESGLLLHAAIGDSHIFLVQPTHSVDLAGRSEPVSFLGDDEVSPQQLAARMTVGAESLADARAIVLVTDGLSERGIGVADPAAAVEAAACETAAADPELCPAILARKVCERALGAQRRQRAGDNIGIAVAWLAGA